MMVMEDYAIMLNRGNRKVVNFVHVGRFRGDIIIVNAFGFKRLS